MAAIWLFVPSRIETTSRRPRERIDFPGTLLLGASLICLSLGLSQEAITSSTGVTGPAVNQAPVQNNPLLIGAAVLLLAVFVVLEVNIERRASLQLANQGAGVSRRTLPIVELSLFKRAAFSATSLVSLLVGAALIIAMADIPLFIATVLGGGPIDSGLALLRLTVMIPVGAIIGGWLCARITCRLTAILGLIPAALGFWLMHLWPVNVGWLQITTIDRWVWHHLRLPSCVWWV
jgi:Na+/melibiose symporter-like transporter